MREKEIKIGLFFPSAHSLDMPTFGIPCLAGFLKSKGINVVQYGFNIYCLTSHSKIFLNPEKYGIKLKYDRKLPFRYFYPFRHITGDIDKVAEKSSEN